LATSNQNEVAGEFLYSIFVKQMLSSTLQLYKNAYSGLSRKTWYLSIVMLVNRSGTMVLPFMTIYCTQKLGFDITQAGTVVGLFGLGAIVGAFFGGRITDRFGFYPQQLVSLFSGGIMFIVTGYMQTFTTLCISSFVLSLCNESFRPANATAIAFYCKEENRTRSYSLNRLAINLGWAVGGALGGFLAGINYHLLFWVDGSTNLASAILLIKLLPYVKSGSRHNKAKTPTAKLPAYKDRIYLFFILLTVMYAFCFFHQFTILPVYFKSQWQLSEQFIGVLMALNGLIIVVIEMTLVYSLEGKRLLTTYIRTGVLMVGIGFALVNVLPAQPWAAVAAVTIISFGEIMSMPFMNSFWIGRTQENNRGQYAAMYTIAWSIAQILAPVGGSHVAAGYGYQVLWWMICIICIVTSAGFMLLGKTILVEKRRS